MVYFADKLLINEKESKKILKDPSQSEMSKFIVQNEIQKSIESNIINLHKELTQLIVERINLQKFIENPLTFLNQFISSQNLNLKILQSNEQSVIEKRSMSDQNEFTNELFDKYEGVLKRNIKKFMKNYTSSQW